MAVEAPTAPAPEGRVLATLNADGSRRWLRPRLSRGRFLTARRATGYALMALFVALPLIRVNGSPAVLLDIAQRRFHLFGSTFFPTDTLLVAVLFIAAFLAIFAATALFGRVWCGWACPQTVYMEFLFRPIERLFEGAPGSARAKRPTPAALKGAKHAAFLVCSFALANVFLAYFVGVDDLRHWMSRSPAEHPGSFALMAAVTGMMMFDFAYFREQTCLVACPYGRIQSVMLDRHSLIVSYDRARGEPRGRLNRGGAPAGEISLRVVPQARGDCIDCAMCVTTCPTGIDIREGLQMECVGCAHCIDACYSVMDKIGKPRGLIGYASQAMREGAARSILRPRLALYPALVALLLGAFVYLLVTKPVAEAAILPRQGAPFYPLGDGEIGNQVRLRIVNRGADAATFGVTPSPEAAALGVRVVTDAEPPVLAPSETHTMGVVVVAPSGAFSERGALEITLVVSDGRGLAKPLNFRMLGPAGDAPRPRSEKEEHE